MVVFRVVCFRPTVVPNFSDSACAGRMMAFLPLVLLVAMGACALVGADYSDGIDYDDCGRDNFHDDYLDNPPPPSPYKSQWECFASSSGGKAGCSDPRPGRITPNPRDLDTPVRI